MKKYVFYFTHKKPPIWTFWPTQYKGLEALCLDLGAETKYIFIMSHSCITLVQGVQHFVGSGPHWKKRCLGPHIKYRKTIKTDEQKKKKKGFK